MVLTKDQIQELYSRRAELYDAAMWLYPLFGLRLNRYRRLAVDALRLRPGDTVIDLGCGTGLNFGPLEKAVGPEGRIIGIDLTKEMLDQAGQRAEKKHWRNIELVQADLAQVAMPEGVDGVLSTLALTMVPEYDRIVQQAARALRPGQRMAIVELKRPEHWPEWLVRAGVWLNRPWGVRLDYADRHPWESIRQHLGEVSFRQLYFGAAYLSVGEVVSGAKPPDTGNVTT